ncbi:MAG: tetratricopeptide repeat protein [Armatimonadetes bacterium]|nr:tetratricopeptide repeat protein [Armatimonadota bacterium]
MAENDLDHLERAAAERPDDPAAHVELALARHQAGRTSEAVEALRRAVELDPDNVEPLLLLAFMEHDLGLGEEVEARLQRAIELDPDNADVYRVIAQTSVRDDQVVDRLFGAARYLELRPGAPDAGEFADRIREVLTEAARSTDYARLGEMLMVVPYVRRALPADEATALEAPLRLRRAEQEADVASAELPAEPAAAALARRAAVGALDVAIEDLDELADLGALDAAHSALQDQLRTRREEHAAAVGRVGLMDETVAVFEALRDAAALLESQQAERAMTGFHDALLQIQALGDDRNGPLAGPAALAYNGLAQALAAAAPEDPKVRSEQLEMALEAAGEAAEREPGMKQRYRPALAAELKELRASLAAAPVAEPPPEPPEREPEPEPEPEPAPAAEQPAAAAEEPEALELEPAAAVEPEPEPVAGEPEPTAAVEPVAEEPEPVVVVSAPEVPAPLAALLEQADGALQAGDAAAAEALYLQVAEDARQRKVAARALLGAARARVLAGDRAGAMSALEEAVGRDRDFLDAHLLRGEIEWEAERYEPAVTAFQYAESVRPDDPRVQRGLGLSLCALRRWREAEQPLLHALAAGDDPLVCYHLGLCYEGMSQLAEAAECFQVAVAGGLQPPYRDRVSNHLEQINAALVRENAAKRQAAQAAGRTADDDEDDDGIDLSARRLIEDHVDLRQRMTSRPSDDGYNPELQLRCPACRKVNAIDAEFCIRCRAPLKTPPGGGGRTAGGRPAGCFVATAACGNALAPEVVALRAWRDQVLLRSRAGRWLAGLYARVSPPLAGFIARRPRLREQVRRRVVAPLAERARRALTRRR